MGAHEMKFFDAQALSKQSTSERIFFFTCFFALSASCFAFVFIFGTVFTKIFSNNLNVLQGEGSLVFQALGSLLILAVAVPVIIAFSVVLSLWRVQEYWTSKNDQFQKKSAWYGFDFPSNSTLTKCFDTVLIVLHSVPSIIWGIFGFAVFVKAMGLGKSWLAGGLTLGFLGFPFLLETAVARGKQIPKETVSAAQSIGMSAVSMAKYVYLPWILSGVLSGMRIVVPRLLGETAPILLTASVFSGVTWPQGVFHEPVLSLPYHIYVLAQDSFNANSLQNAWNSAFALVLISLVLRFGTTYVQSYWEKKWFPKY
jgi:ABC-type molybdate transport system permease subunit